MTASVEEENAGIETESGADTGTSGTKRRKRPATIEDVFSLCTETNDLVKASAEKTAELDAKLAEIAPRVETVTTAVAEHETRIDNLEKRVSSIEQTRSASDANSPTGQSRSRENSPAALPASTLFVVGKSGPDAQRPAVSEVASVLKIAESEIKVVWPGAKVVQILADSGSLPVLRHKAAGTGLWVDHARSPAELSAWKEWRLVKSWAAELPEFQGTAQYSAVALAGKNGKTLVRLADKRDRVVWVCEALKLKWLSR